MAAQAVRRRADHRQRDHAASLVHVYQDGRKIPNASAGTDLNGRGAQFPARHVRDNPAQLVWNDKGLLTTYAPSTYKIPTAGDVPEHFKVELWSEPNFEDNVFGSKAVGEPPLMLAISVYEALRDAVAQAPGAHVPSDRAESGCRWGHFLGHHDQRRDAQTLHGCGSGASKQAQAVSVFGAERRKECTICRQHVFGDQILGQELEQFADIQTSAVVLMDQLCGLAQQLGVAGGVG